MLRLCHFCSGRYGRINNEKCVVPAQHLFAAKQKNKKYGQNNFCCLLYVYSLFWYADKRYFCFICVAGGLDQKFLPLFSLLLWLLSVAVCTRSRSTCSCVDMGALHTNDDVDWCEGPENSKEKTLKQTNKTDGATSKSYTSPHRHCKRHCKRTSLCPFSKLKNSRYLDSKKSESRLCLFFMSISREIKTFFLLSSLLPAMYVWTDWLYKEINNAVLRHCKLARIHLV